MATEAEKQPGEEGTVDHDGFAKFVQGQAQADEGGDTPPAEGPQEKPDDIIEVSIKGKKVKMTREAAEAHAAFVRDTRERDGRLGGELAQLRERSARLEGIVESVRAERRTDEQPTIKPPPADLAESDFAEYHRQMLAYHEAKIEEQRATLETRYETDQREQRTTSEKETAEKLWAERFYRVHPHLNKPRLRKIVFDVYRENVKEINGYTDEGEQHERLAELADEAVVSITQDGKDITAPTINRPPRLEGGGTPAPAGKGKPEPKFEPVTAAGWSAKKRAALRGGR